MAAARPYRLPKQFRVNSAKVYLKATPEGFLVIPRNPWEVFAERVQELSQRLHGRRAATTETPTAELAL